MLRKIAGAAAFGTGALAASFLSLTTTGLSRPKTSEPKPTSTRLAYQRSASGRPVG